MIAGHLIINSALEIGAQYPYIRNSLKYSFTTKNTKMHEDEYNFFSIHYFVSFVNFVVKSK